MWKKYIKDNLFSSNNSLKSSWIKDDGKYLKEKNIQLWEFLNSYAGRYLTEKIYLYMNNLDKIPVCSCGNELSLITYKQGYPIYCSNKCSNSSKDKINKIKQTCLDKYGVDSPSKINSAKEKKKKTCNEKYGGNAPSCSNQVKDKIKQTCLDKYGCEYSSQSDIVKNKVKQTCLDRYGTNNAGKLEDIKIKRENTCLNRYGSKYPIQLDEFKNKVRETCLKKYGYSWTSYNLKEKMKNMYGVDNPLYIEDIKLKIKRTIKRKRYDLFKEQLYKKKIELLSSKDSYINDDIYSFKCLICGNEFESDGTNYQHVTCKCRKNVSLLELELVEWLKSLNILIEHSNKNIIYPLELDIYLPDYKLGIEFDGIWWHSENAGTDRNYHLDKTIRCNIKGIQLIHVFENEWLNQQDIVKSIILSKLGRYDRKIYARQCKIKELLDSEYKSFMELNHIQGHVPAKYRYGLYYNDELVHVCSFGKSRFKKGEIELIRSCSLINTQVVGGFDKLIRYFVSEYKPEVLISYVDRRYFDGHGYKNWKLIGDTKPNYWYIKKNGNMILESRMKYQKHKLFRLLDKYDSDKSEYENMCDNGYLRIWDCGNLKFML